MIELNRMTAIEAKLCALMNKIGNHERRMHSANEWEQLMKMRREIVLKMDYPMRVPIKLRRHSISMQIEVTILSPTSTCQLITHQHLGTMRISLMEEEHSKVEDLGRIINNIMLHLGSNKDNSSSKEVREHKIRDNGDLLPLKNRC